MAAAMYQLGRVLIKAPLGGITFVFQRSRCKTRKANWAKDGMAPSMNPILRPRCVEIQIRCSVRLRRHRPFSAGNICSQCFTIACDGEIFTLMIHSAEKDIVAQQSRPTWRVGQLDECCFRGAVLLCGVFKRIEFQTLGLTYRGARVCKSSELVGVIQKSTSRCMHRGGAPAG